MEISEIEYAKVLKIRQEVMYPDKNLDFVKLENDNNGIHLGVLVANNPVSIMSIFIDNESVQFRKLATLQNMQRKGYASKLMKWLLDYAKDMKLAKLWCNARVDACDFYKKFGYKETDKRFSKNGHDYVVMELVFNH